MATPQASSGSRQSTTSTLEEEMQDPDSCVWNPETSRTRRLGFAGYFLLCLAVVAGISGAAVGLWSDMACQEACFSFLEEQRGLARYCLAVVLVVLLVLYLLDFFWPPHLPGRFCTLNAESALFARCFLVAGVVALLAAGYLSANSYPTLPLVITIFLCPTCIILLRKATMPKERFIRGRPSELMKGKEDFHARMVMLKALTGVEQDQKSFYNAATYAFAVGGVLCAVAWVPWAVRDNYKFNDQMDSARDRDEQELIFVRWVAPLMVAVSNIIFAGFSGLRLVLNRTYSATDEVKNRLIVGDRSCMNEELMNHRISMLQEQLAGESDAHESVLKATEDKMQQYLVQHISHMRQLSNIVKMVGCAFIALIGALYIAFQLAAANSHIAFMVQIFSGAFFLTFIAFVFVSFHRLWQALSVWLMDLPLWKSAVSLCERDWARAITVVLLAPLLPVVVVLSLANQGVRRLRGLSRADRWLTERMGHFIASARSWNWVNVLFWIYVTSTVLMVYKMVPVFLNLLLAYMSCGMESFPFVLILVATFAAGMVLFMLPPVPGPPIYLFGGVVISDKCPMGFWWGSVICISLCFVLKLVACAVQQKLIGERLGGRQSVRRLVRVHKPFMRAVEAVLRRPGLDFGKCMILCGGPDWPTSVLAGILRLSLRQCLIGTLPIILSVVPLALTGSFYLKKDHGEVWTRGGNLMFSLTLLVSVVFWAGTAWAIQDEFDRHHAQLMRPREEDIELEWLDYREACIAERCNVTWDSVPRCVLVVYAGGAVGVTLVGTAILWRSPMCFGTFQVTQDVSTVNWSLKDGVIRLPGAVLLSVAAVAYLGLFVFESWRRRRNLKTAAEAARELDGDVCQAWKDKRLQEARRASQRGPQQLSSALLETLEWRLPAVPARVEAAEGPAAGPQPEPIGACVVEGSLCDTAQAQRRPLVALMGPGPLATIEEVTSPACSPSSTLNDGPLTWESDRSLVEAEAWADNRADKVRLPFFEDAESIDVRLESGEHGDASQRPVGSRSRIIEPPNHGLHGAFCDCSQWGCSSILY